ncbi:MAG: hypothetical protein ACE5HC_02600 [Candidatus Binatia bacterium]
MTNSFQILTPASQNARVDCTGASTTGGFGEGATAVKRRKELTYDGTADL